MNEDLKKFLISFSKSESAKRIIDLLNLHINQIREERDSMEDPVNLKGSKQTINYIKNLIQIFTEGKESKSNNREFE